MHTFHPIFGEIVTSNRLVRSGRWVFRGTIVLLDDVFADLSEGMNLHGVWEKHGALDSRDLETVATLAFGEHADALRDRSGDMGLRLNERGDRIRSERRAAA